MSVAPQQPRPSGLRFRRNFNLHGSATAPARGGGASLGEAWLWVQRLDLMARDEPWRARRAVSRNRVLSLKPDELMVWPAHTDSSHLNCKYEKM